MRSENDQYCVQSPNYPDRYPSYQSCIISNVPAIPMTVTSFATEAKWDLLYINGVGYSGYDNVYWSGSWSRRPSTSDQIISTGEIKWHSDSCCTPSSNSVSPGNGDGKVGWRICWYPPPPPAAPPPGLPAAPPSDPSPPGPPQPPSLPPEIMHDFDVVDWSSSTSASDWSTPTGSHAWTHNSGPTASFGTGPDGGHSNSSHYLYAEMSGGMPGDLCAAHFVYVCFVARVTTHAELKRQVGQTLEDVARNIACFPPG